MISLYNGVQAEIEMQYHLAIYMHWGFHIWNLTLVKASRLDLIQMPYGYLQKVYFSCSLQKTSVIGAIFSVASKKKQKCLCFSNTQWIERHDNFITYLELFPAVIGVLEIFADNQSNSGLMAKANF